MLWAVDVRIVCLFVCYVHLCAKKLPKSNRQNTMTRWQSTVVRTVTVSEQSSF